MISTLVLLVILSGDNGGSCYSLGVVLFSEVEYVTGGNSKRCPNVSQYADTLIMMRSFFVGYEVLGVMLRLNDKYVK